MKVETYLDLKFKVIDAGYEGEVGWAESLRPCTSAGKFRDEYIWVVLNAGMKEQVAREIYRKINEAMQIEIPIEEVFGHKGKVEAIKKMNDSYEANFAMFLDVTDKLAFLETLPWIGKITKYHLAKNLGIDHVKPDRHLVRIAKKYKTTCLEMCKKLANETGDRLSVIDVVIWRAANLGFI